MTSRVLLLHLIPAEKEVKVALERGDLIRRQHFIIDVNHQLSLAFSHTDDMRPEALLFRPARPFSVESEGWHGCRMTPIRREG